MKLYINKAFNNIDLIIVNKSFSDNGYVIIRNAIKKSLIKEIQSTIYNLLEINENTKNSQYSKFCNLVKNLKTSEYDFVKPIFEFIFYKNLIEKILNEKKILNTITDLLGKDLAFCYDNSISLNLPNKSSPKKNYLFKDWHQEIWSGASFLSIQIWIPLISRANNYNKLNIMEESHKWGHIPHMNRAPISLPKKHKIITANLKIGDVLIFTTLLLHRSVSVNSPLLSLPVLIKNFKNKDSSFEENRNWKIFSYSELTKIERILGNHYLSPYRIKDLK